VRAAVAEGQNMVALVIDDSRAMRAMIARMVRELGYEVVEAADGREALQKLDEGLVPSFALVDWNMPKMNGLEFVESVRSGARLEGVPLMMVTTEIESSQVMRALEAGANEYLMKPFTREALVEKLELLGVGSA
jgi:two-component system, chemotaxis family, chemotaxis protein CheY